MKFSDMSPERRLELQRKGGKSRSMKKVWWAKRNGVKACREGLRRGRPSKVIEGEANHFANVFASEPLG